MSELFQSRTATYTSDEKSYQRSFLVLVDGISDTPYAAINASGIPALGAIHPEDTARVISKSVSPVDGQQKAYQVSVEYSSKSEEEDPLDTADKISWQGRAEVEAVFRDIDDTPLANSAGEPIEQDIERLTPMWVANITRKVADTFDISTLKDLVGTVNDNSITVDGVSIDAGFALFDPPSLSEIQTENDIDFRELTMSIQIRQDRRWDELTIFDVGFEEKNGDGQRVPILGLDGTRIKKPWPLDGNGAKKPNATDEPAELEFKIYQEADWSGLSLS